MNNPYEFYASRTAAYSRQLTSIKQWSAGLSATRLAVFIGLAACSWGYYTNHHPALLILALFLAAAFVLLVRRSISLNDKKKLTARLLFINENETGVLKGKDNAFDDGSGTRELSMPAVDLDVFGKRSLYHSLNRTTTPTGAQSLARLLNHPFTSEAEVLKHQAAVAGLSSQPDTRQLITARGLLQDHENNSIDPVLRWIDDPVQLFSKNWVLVARFVFPAIAVAGLLLYLSDGHLWLLATGIALNWVLTGRFAAYIRQQHVLIGQREAVLQQYGTILNVFCAAEAGDSLLLKELKTISADGRQAILRLSSLSNLFDQRLNLLVGLFLNRFLVYDIHVMIALEHWKKRNRPHFQQWIGAAGEIEKLNSLATFQFNHPNYTTPAVVGGRPFVRATALAHPLIPGGAQVANDIVAGEKEKLLLITGSNMSGKSTFLRTIGVNVLMAQCGLPVCAKAFSFTPVHLLSSIRISDSLQENTSYFMAELKRLKEIIDTLIPGTPSLVLIDEVLRGTNSDDKTFGSEELIRKLASYNCLAFFATHDLSLSALEKMLPGQVKNYCFESTIENDELIFDYKLRSGVAANKNASFLMKKMGIIG